MWFFKVKYKHKRAYKVLRARSSILNIILFLSGLSFRNWRDIETIKIERIK